MLNANFVETITWSDDANTVVLTRTFNADYKRDKYDELSIIKVIDTLDQDIDVEGPDSDELNDIINDDEYVEGESFEDFGLEQTDYSLTFA